MDQNHHDARHTHAQDEVEAGFDSLRLDAPRLRMLTDQARHRNPDVVTGNQHSDAVLRQVLSQLTKATDDLADETDRAVEHFHPLYLTDKHTDRPDSGAPGTPR